MATPSASMAGAVSRKTSCVGIQVAGVGLLQECPGARPEDGACPQRSVTDEPRGPGALLEQPEGPRLFSRPTSWPAPHRPLRVCSSLAPRWTRKSLAAKHQPFVRHDTRPRAAMPKSRGVGWPLISTTPTRLSVPRVRPSMSTSMSRPSSSRRNRGMGATQPMRKGSKRMRRNDLQARPSVNVPNVFPSPPIYRASSFSTSSSSSRLLPILPSISCRLPACSCSSLRCCSAA